MTVMITKRNLAPLPYSGLVTGFIFWLNFENLQKEAKGLAAF